MIKNLITYWKNIKTTGMIVPTSSFALEKMVEGAELKKAKVILEYGAGEGTTTKYVLDRMGPETQLFAFEINEDFVKELGKIDDPRLTILNCGAEQAKDELAKRGVSQVDFVFSYIPISFLKRELTREIIEATQELLVEGGKFSQIQYNLALFSTIQEYMPTIKHSFVARNVPPAFIYYYFK